MAEQNYYPASGLRTLVSVVRTAGVRELLGRRHRPLMKQWLGTELLVIRCRLAIRAHKAAAAAYGGRNAVLVNVWDFLCFVRDLFAPPRQ
jgi:hypothetical protein